MFYIKHIKQFLSFYKHSLLFSLGVYFFSLIFNTSFRVMGYDLSSEFSSALNSNLFFVMFFTNLKILILYFLFYGSIQWILNVFYENWNKQQKYYYTIFITFSLLNFFYSIVEYPQIYGDFFYNKHFYLKWLLYFLTDYYPHTITPFIFVILITLVFVYLAYLFLKTGETRFFVCFIVFVSFAVLHYEGSFWGVFGIFFLGNYFFFKNWKLQKIYFIPISLVFIFAFSGYIYYKEFFEFSSNFSEKQIKVFLISADSLRKDKISFKINNESITPNIDQFLQDSVSFEDHHVTIPRTFPSWADLLTGQYSMAHKVRDMFPSPEEVKNIGSEEFPTLPQYLSEIGVETFVFSNFAGDIFPRANFGFQRVFAPTFNAKVLVIQKSLESQIFLLPILTGAFLGGGKYFSEIDSFASLGDGKRILKEALPFFRMYKNRNIFTSLFFSVTHFPYSPPYPFYKKFSNPNYKGDYRYFKYVDPTVDQKPNEEDIQQIHAIFHASINAFDSEFGELLTYLKNLGIYDESLIILTADHGESLYEDVHGHGHGEHLRGEHVTKIPLMIKFPKEFQTKFLCLQNQTCKQIFSISSSVDILPTILEIYNIQNLKETAGRSLLEILRDGKWKDDRLVYTETGIWFSDIGDHFFQNQRIQYPNILQLHRIVPEQDFQIMITDPHYRETIAFAKHRAVLSSKYKLIYIPTHDGVLWEAYDRISDPLNQKNIYNPYMFDRFKKEIYSIAEKYEKAKIVGGYILPPSIEE